MSEKLPKKGRHGVEDWEGLSEGGTNGCEGAGVGEETHPPPPPPHPGLWTGSLLLSIYCLFFFFSFSPPVVFLITALRRGAPSGDATSTSSTRDIPGCTAQGPSSQQREGRWPSGDCLLCSTTAPHKTMSLCDIDGMHALLLKKTKKTSLFHVVSFWSCRRPSCSLSVSIFLPPLLLTVSYHLVKSTPLHRLARWTFCLSPLRHCNDLWLLTRADPPPPLFYVRFYFDRGLCGNS